MGQRANALADRLEQGAKTLATFAGSLSDADWQKRVPRDNRKVGVIVHHVASVYPIEVQLAQLVASGKPVEVPWAAVHDMNAKHAQDNDKVTKQEAVALLQKNSAEAAKAIRGLSDAQLDTAAANSLSANAPLTCQFFIEDHALRHSFYHLMRIKETLGR